ncbi:MAG: histidine phosphatase family protein, partial [Micromonosporaceae bacterium]
VRTHPLLHEGHVGDLDARVDEEAHQALEDLLACWQLEGDLERCRPGGESGAVLLDRMRRVVADVLADLAPSPDLGPGASIVVSHGAILRVALPRICDGVQPEHTLTHHLPNAVWAVVDVVDAGAEPPKLVCRSWAEATL